MKAFLGRPGEANAVKNAGDIGTIIVMGQNRAWYFTPKSNLLLGEWEQWRRIGGWLINYSSKIIFSLYKIFSLFCSVPFSISKLVNYWSAYELIWDSKVTNYETDLSAFPYYVNPTAPSDILREHTNFLQDFTGKSLERSVQKDRIWIDPQLATLRSTEKPKLQPMGWRGSDNWLLKGRLTNPRLGPGPQLFEGGIPLRNCSS